MTVFRRSVSVLVLGLGLLTLAPISVPAALADYTCDATHPNTEFRWPIKSLSDPDRQDVDFTPIRTTVNRLRHLDRPSVSVQDDTPRIAPQEKRTYKVRARPVKAKVEGDGDVILVVAVPGHIRRTMVVEFGNPRCVTDSFRRTRIGAARRRMLNNCGPLGSGFTAVRGSLHLRGVGYWDRRSSEEGSAPNAFQLWPVLAIRGTCSHA
jgi:hypothetical protein